MSVRERTRKKSVLTGVKIEELWSLNYFPVYMGCTEQPMERDVLADMSFGICLETGIIQLTKLLPLDLVYLGQHNDATGGVWLEHHDSFVDFLGRFSARRVLEIGGGSGYIADKYLESHPGASWTIIEPNPNIKARDRLEVRRGWFDENLQVGIKPDTVAHTHVFEHAYDPVGFMRQISSFLAVGSRHVFAFPNMYELLKGKHANCLNFEHTCFLREEYVDVLLQNFGFKILEKQYFRKHSIFYATEKMGDELEQQSYPNFYQENKQMFLDLVDLTNSVVEQWNDKLAKEPRPVYLFGAHIFSQWLLAFGLDDSKIVSILDNSPLKIGKRLYGTKFKVESPKVLASKEGVVVLLKAAGYNEEIKADILENINPAIEFWE